MTVPDFLAYLNVIGRVAQAVTGKVYVAELQFQGVIRRSHYPPPARLICGIKVRVIRRLDDAAGTAQNSTAHFCVRTHDVRILLSRAWRFSHEGIANRGSIDWYFHEYRCPAVL